MTQPLLPISIAVSNPNLFEEQISAVGLPKPIQAHLAREIQKSGSEQLLRIQIGNALSSKIVHFREPEFCKAVYDRMLPNAPIEIRNGQVNPHPTSFLSKQKTDLLLTMLDDEVRDQLATEMSEKFLGKELIEGPGGKEMFETAKRLQRMALEELLAGSSKDLKMLQRFNDIMVEKISKYNEILPNTPEWERFSSFLKKTPSHQYHHPTMHSMMSSYVRSPVIIQSFFDKALGRQTFAKEDLKPLGHTWKIKVSSKETWGQMVHRILTNISLKILSAVTSHAQLPKVTDTIQKAMTTVQNERTLQVLGVSADREGRIDVVSRTAVPNEVHAILETPLPKSLNDGTITNTAAASFADAFSRWEWSYTNPYEKPVWQFLGNDHSLHYACSYDPPKVPKGSEGTWKKLSKIAVLQLAASYGANTVIPDYSRAVNFKENLRLAIRDLSEQSDIPATILTACKHGLSIQEAHLSVRSFIHACQIQSKTGDPIWVSKEGEFRCSWYDPGLLYKWRQLDNREIMLRAQAYMQLATDQAFNVGNPIAYELRNILLPLLPRQVHETTLPPQSISNPPSAAAAAATLQTHEVLPTAIRAELPLASVLYPKEKLNDLAESLKKIDRAGASFAADCARLSLSCNTLIESIAVASMQKFDSRSFGKIDPEEEKVFRLFKEHVDKLHSRLQELSTSNLLTAAQEIEIEENKKFVEKLQSQIRERLMHDFTEAEILEVSARIANDPSYRWTSRNQLVNFMYNIERSLTLKISDRPGLRESLNAGFENLLERKDAIIEQIERRAKRHRR